MKRAIIAATLLLTQALSMHANAQEAWSGNMGANANSIVASSDPSGRLRQALRAHGGFGGLLANMASQLPTPAQERRMYQWSRKHDPVGRYVFDDNE
jgi:hypothetical protein